MTKPTPAQRALRHLAAMQRAYARAERALIRAALVGCVRRDPAVADQREASSSGRAVDLWHEVSELRMVRNELTMAERELKRAKRKKGGNPKRKIIETARDESGNLLWREDYRFSGLNRPDSTLIRDSIEYVVVSSKLISSNEVETVLKKGGRR